MMYGQTSLINLINSGKTKQKKQKKTKVLSTININWNLLMCIGLIKVSRAYIHAHLTCVLGKRL